MPESRAPHPTASSSRTHRQFVHWRTLAGLSALAVLTLSLLHGASGVAGWTVSGPTLAEADLEPAGHLVVSEVMTGGTSASDEFVELYNPTLQQQSLDGLELVYVSASGATITRKASWTADDPAIPSGGHLLIANDAGVHAAVADAVYANGLAAAGGSVALRSIGASQGIDTVAWGSAASSWVESSPAPAPLAGHSLERLPGGSAGSGQDSDDNSADFVERAAPDPQNASSVPIPPTSPTQVPTPSASPSPTSVATPTGPPTASPTPIATASPTPPPTPSPTSTASPTATPTPSPTATPIPSPTATPIPPPTPDPDLTTIAGARALPDGSLVSVEGVSLTDGSFADGGGYVVDQTGGIAVLVSSASFPRGVLLRVHGEVDDRYHQRTIRVASDGLTLGEPAPEPDPLGLTTGGIGEEYEGQLVHVAGVIAAAPSRLSSGVAFDLDDGSGPARVVIGDATGIDVGGMQRGVFVDLVGVLGQRDSSGTGTEGYRVQPRDTHDVISVGEPGSSPGASPGPTSAPGEIMTIADARSAEKNAHVRVRGVVTLPSTLLGDGTAAIQDETGAIVLRLGDEAGALALGELVIVDGIRSTKSGMETIRASEPPLRLGTLAQPTPFTGATGSLGEAQEALVVRVSGSVASAPRRTTSQNVYFDVDDGSGPLRVFVVPSAAIDTAAIAAGTRVQVTGVLGQETTGQQPLRGYRIWPRASSDLVVQPTSGAGVQLSTTGGAAVALGRIDAGDPASATSPGSSPAAVLLPLPVPAVTVRAPVESRTEPTPRPDNASASVALDEGAYPDLAVQAALLAVVALGTTGALAAGRPGLYSRLSVGLGRVLAGLSRTSAPPGPEPAGVPVASAAATLVPLRVADGGAMDASRGVGGPHDPRTQPRSGRILPPT